MSECSSCSSVARVVCFTLEFGCRASTTSDGDDPALLHLAVTLLEQITDPIAEVNFRLAHGVAGWGLRVERGAVFRAVLVGGFRHTGPVVVYLPVAQVVVGRVIVHIVDPAVYAPALAEHAVALHGAHMTAIGTLNVVRHDSQVRCIFVQGVTAVNQHPRALAESAVHIRANAVHLAALRGAGVFEPLRGLVL